MKNTITRDFFEAVAGRGGEGEVQKLGSKPISVLLIFAALLGRWAHTNPLEALVRGLREMVGAEILTAYEAWKTLGIFLDVKMPPCYSRQGDGGFAYFNEVCNNLLDSNRIQEVLAVYTRMYHRDGTSQWSETSPLVFKKGDTARRVRVEGGRYVVVDAITGEKVGECPTHYVPSAYAGLVSVELRNEKFRKETEQKPAAADVGRQGPAHIELEVGDKFVDPGWIVNGKLVQGRIDTAKPGEFLIQYPAENGVVVGSRSVRVNAPEHHPTSEEVAEIVERIKNLQEEEVA